MEIAGRVVVVTGASSGIGAATARLAHARGARVVLAARRTERLERLRDQLEGSVVMTADVTREDDVRRVVDTAVEALGRVDVLVNNAGQGLHVPLEDVALDAFRDILELNVVAPLAAMQAVLPVMRAQGGGAIVNVSSGTARKVLPGVGAYSASKAALTMLSRVARAELAGDGIVVSLVFPSVTATEFHDSLRQGSMPGGGTALAPQPPEVVAEAVLRAVETGEEEIVLSHRPRDPGPDSH